MWDERFDRIEQRLERLETGQTALRADVSVGFGRFDGRIDDLDQRMHVLHEDVIARIAAIPEYPGPTKAEFASLREMIERRLDPLEAVVREHSAEIEQLKHARG